MDGMPARGVVGSMALPSRRLSMAGRPPARAPRKRSRCRPRSGPARNLAAHQRRARRPWRNRSPPSRRGGPGPLRRPTTSRIECAVCRAADGWPRLVLRPTSTSSPGPPTPRSPRELAETGADTVRIARRWRRPRADRPLPEHAHPGGDAPAPDLTPGDTRRSSRRGLGAGLHPVRFGRGGRRVGRASYAESPRFATRRCGRLRCRVRRDHRSASPVPTCRARRGRAATGVPTVASRSDAVDVAPYRPAPGHLHLFDPAASLEVFGRAALVGGRSASRVPATGRHLPRVCPPLRLHDDILDSPRRGTVPWPTMPRTVASIAASIRERPICHSSSPPPPPRCGNVGTTPRSRPVRACDPARLSFCWGRPRCVSLYGASPDGRRCPGHRYHQFVCVTRLVAVSADARHRVPRPSHHQRPDSALAHAAEPERSCWARGRSGDRATRRTRSELPCDRGAGRLADRRRR